MSGQNKNIQKKGVKAPVKAKSEELRVKSEKSTNTQYSILNKDWFLLAIILLITFICFHFTLYNQFLDWDDGMYVNNDKYITSFTASHIFSILFENITQNYYHPITMMTFALNYHFSGMNPMGYFATAIFVHLLNVVMVFYFTRALMNSMTDAGYKFIKAVPWLAATLALWYGIHPMHVESVSWVSERKDVMYSFFYFLGLMMYLKYLKGEKMPRMLYFNLVFTALSIWGLIGLSSFSLDFAYKGHAFSIPGYMLFGFLILMYGGAALVEFKYKNIRLELFYVFEIFLLSLWSKPMAVSFPLSLLAIDVLMKRDLDMLPKKKIYSFISAIFSFTGKSFSGFITRISKLVFEKWLFWLTCVLSGIQSVIMQVASGSLVITHGYTLFQKLLIACYSFMMYTTKAFWPFTLCSYYPYPGLTHDHHIEYPIFYYAPIIDLLYIGVPLLIAYFSRKNKDAFRVVLFCILFFFANVVFILQFVSSGTTIISDRYSYVSYFGYFFLFIYLANWFWNKNKSNHLLIQGSIAIVTCIMAYLTYQRVRVWHDNKSLWSDVINKTNERSELPYLNLGDWYILDKQMPDSAYPYFTTLVRLHTKNPEVYRSLGKIYGMHQKFDSSLAFQNESIRLDSGKTASSFMDRGVTYCMMGKLDLGIKDFNKSYSMDSTDPGLWAYRATSYIQTGQYSLALYDLNKLVIKHPDEGNFFYQQGTCEANLGNQSAAIANYLKAISLNPKNGSCMYSLSMAYENIADYKGALAYAQKAKIAGAAVPDDYMAKLQKLAQR